MPHHLTKSSFVAGWQCPNLLWWNVHESDAPERVPTLGRLHQMEQGRQVGEAARDYVPGGVTISRLAPLEDRVTQTERALASEAPAIYNASFLADDVFVEVDILERTDGGFNLIEVKSSTGVRDEHIPDVAIQSYVLQRAGVPVRRAELMHVNGDCRHPDLTDLFVRADVTALVDEVLPGIPTEIAEQREVLDRPHPALPFGPQCFDMDGCPYHDRCWPERTKDHVLSLARIGLRRAYELMQHGVHSIHDLPIDAKIPKIAQRQARAVTHGHTVIGAKLGAALEPFVPPLAFLDFETIRLAIPIWEGCWPWQQLPVQFSCHHLAEDGTLTHREWLAESSADPREPLARALIEACRDAARVVAYWSSFERARITELAEALPHLADELEEITTRLVDLHPVVRDHVYHPDFLGSFSLKAVVPALLPGLGYDDLEVADGNSASALLARHLLQPSAFEGGERADLRRDLLAYCERDTLVLVALLHRLQSMAARSRA
jgi:predicted RecB family nuclease